MEKKNKPNKRQSHRENFTAESDDKKSYVILWLFACILATWAAIGAIFIF